MGIVLAVWRVIVDVANFWHKVCHCSLLHFHHIYLPRRLHFLCPASRHLDGVAILVPNRRFILADSREETPKLVHAQEPYGAMA